jgi:HD-like signal output (HDOD) protein
LYNIDCAKLPSCRKVSFPCKACKGTIKLDLRSKPAKDDLSVSIQAPKDNGAVKPLQPASQSGGNQESQVLKKKILQDLMGVLPPMPQVVLKAQEILSNPDSSIKELASVIATDPAISVRILKMANSAYFGLAGKVTSIGHASVLLGGKILGEIVMMAGTSNLLSKTLKGYGVESEDIWRHSLAVGIGSRLIANIKKPDLINDAFMAGLIHDSGKIMLDDHVVKRKKEFEDLMMDPEKTFYEVEQQLLGLDHSEIGYEVCKCWGIPEILTAAVRYHHNPCRSQDNDLAHIVHMADFLAIQSDMGAGVDLTQCRVGDKTREFLDLKERDYDGIKQKVVEYVEKITGQMNNS